jgi:hypothetical protein
MMYYGAFTGAGGCGSMWRPYFASAAWDPYSNGVWAWYQGAGYSWVSPYPWGWTPFHTGSWSYCSGVGWGWRPGGSWNGLNNTAAIMSGGGATAIASGGSPVRPPRPVRPPGAGAPTLSEVNVKPLVRSQAVSADSFEFRKDSAGLGIPREGMGKLDRLSHDAINHGAATTPIYMSAPTPAMRNGQRTNEGVVPTSIHRGSAGPSTGQVPSERGPSNGENRSAGRSGSETSGQPSRQDGQSGGQPQRTMSQPNSQPERSMPQQSSQPMSPPSSQPAPEAAPAQGRPR